MVTLQEPLETALKPRSSRLPGGWGGWTSAVFLALGCLHAFSLLRFPPPFIDEAWYASHALGVLHTGRPLGPLHQGVFASIEGAWTYFPIIGSLLPALAIHLLGVNILAVRLVALAFGLALLLSVYVIARRLYGQRAGILVLPLLGVSAPFFLSAHLARPDVAVAAAGFGAIALYLTGGGSTSLVKSMLAGLLIGLAFEYHPNASIFGPVLVALYLADHKTTTFRQRTFWGFIGGCSAALLLYAIIHIAPYPQTFFSMTSFAFGDSKTPPLLSPSSWAASLHEASGLIFAGIEFRTPLVLAALLLLARRRARADRCLLVILVVMFVQLVAITPYKPGYYAIIFSPAYDLVLTAFLDALLGLRWRGSLRSLLVTVLLVSLLVASTLQNLAVVTTNGTEDYERLTGEIRAVAPAASTIMGEPAYWFGLQDYAYVGMDQVGLYRRLHPGARIDDIMAIYRPDFLILDWFTERHVMDSPHDTRAVSGTYRMPRAEFLAFLEQRTRLVATIRSHPRGEIQVRQVNWTTARQP